MRRCAWLRSLSMASLLVLSLSLSACLGPPGPGIFGKVEAATGRGLPGAYVELREVHETTLDRIDYSGPPVAVVRSDGDGDYRLGGLYPGLWLLTVVGSERSLAEEELARWAHPDLDDVRPADIGVSRYIWTITPNLTSLGRLSSFGGVSSSDSFWGWDLCVPVFAPADGEGVVGRLTGHFDPERVTTVRALDGQGAVPRSDGSFSLGPMRPGYSTYGNQLGLRVQLRDGTESSFHRSAQLQHSVSTGFEFGFPTYSFEVPDSQPLRLRVRLPEGCILDDETWIHWSDLTPTNKIPRVPLAIHRALFVGDPPHREMLLPRGEYRLKVVAEGYASSVHSVSLNEETSGVTLDVPLLKAVSTTLRFVDAEGEPVPVVAIVIEDPQVESVEPKRVEARFAPTSEVPLDDALPMPYTIEVTTVDGRTLRFDVELSEVMPPIVLGAVAGG